MSRVGSLRSVAAWIAFLLIALPQGCADRERVGEPDGDGSNSFTLGPVSEYSVQSDVEISLPDSLTQCVFRFPEGGAGTLAVARILSGPVEPFPGSGFAIEYSGPEPVEVLVPETPGGRTMVFGYGQAEGLFDDVTQSPQRWLAVPAVDTLDSRIAFHLTMPSEQSGKPALEGLAAAAVAPRRGFSRYWFTSIPAGSNDMTRMIHMELQASSYVDDFLAALTPARRALVGAEVNGRMRRNFAYDGLYYDGFWWRSLGSVGRRIHPTIHLTMDANTGNIAHETGHYLVHALIGDDAQSILEGQQPIWNTEHGIGDPIGRERIADDYAFVLEWFLTGGIKSDDPLDPHVMFLNRSPLTDDFPGTEGFATTLLAALTRTEPTMKDLTSGKPVNVPAPALSDDRLFEIIARGATGVNELRVEIERELGPRVDLLSPMAQRCGWSYSVRGRFVDPSGHPVSGVIPSCFTRTAGVTYEGGWSQIASKADGRFSIVGDVFPGASRIRAVADGDTVEVAISVDWTRPTDESVELQDLVVSFPPKVVSLSPDHGKAGDAVEIVGRRFGAAQGTSAVNFGGVAAATTSWSDTRIMATVPVGARSGDVAVTVAGIASRGVPFTVEGGRWVLDGVENQDVQPQNGTWLNINTFAATNGTISIRSGYDNPNFAEVWGGDWETTVEGSWTVPPAELIPGETIDLSLSISTAKIRVDDPPTQSAKSTGWISVSSSGTPALDLQGTASEVYHLTVPPPTGYPLDQSVIAIWLHAGGYSGGGSGAGYAGSVYRTYRYRYQSN